MEPFFGGAPVPFKGQSPAGGFASLVLEYDPDETILLTLCGPGLTGFQLEMNQRVFGGFSFFFRTRFFFSKPFDFSLIPPKY